MNTQQIKDIVISDVELQTCFGGVYSANEFATLHKILKDKIYIVNTDENEGKHWTVFYFNNKNI